MYIIGAVFEKEQCKVALFDKEYKLLLEKCGMSADISKLCLDIISQSGINPSDVDYIGIAFDGFSSTPDFAIADVEKSIGIKCYGASFMSTRALGEAYTTNDVPSLLMLKIDDTVECGMVEDKKIYLDARQLGVRVAHMVINLGGYECTCGRKGCFESYVSNSGLKRIAAESGVADAESLTHKKLFDMDTPVAELAKKLYVKYLASGITDIINLFQPQELVLDGPFTEVGDELMKPMMDIILREQYSHSMPNKCNVRFAKDKEYTALIGAALLGR